MILNTGNDINDLVDKGLINKNWDKQSYNGVVWNSVVVFGLRDGNPKKIKGWNDLLRPGVRVVTVNPFTGGIAKWNILAAYVAQRRLGKTEKQAIAYLQKFYKNNVVSQDSSGSNATNTFLSGKGDVLLTFESEAINGKIPFVIPRQTMLIDIYIAGLEKSQHKDEWNAFSRFLKTYPAQKILAENGYRPVNKQALTEFRKQVPGPARARRRSRTSCSAAGAPSTRSGSTRTRASCSRSSSRSGCPLAEHRHRGAGPSGARRAPQGESLDRLSPCRWGSSRRSCSIIVVLPIAAVVWKSTGNGWSGFWQVVSSPQAVSALKLTLVMSTLAVLTTAVFGTIIAWVLVRDSFAGKSVVNAIIDLPFALPTIVAGLVIMALYGPRTPIDFTIGGSPLRRQRDVHAWRDLRRAAVRHAPVRRPRGAARPDGARHGARGGRAVARGERVRDVPPRRPAEHPPGILSGVAMAFARAIGEIGAIVLIAGNLPFKTEVASIYLFHRIEQDPEGSAAVAVVLLLISFAVLLGHRCAPLVRHEARAWVGSRSGSPRSATWRSSSSGRS